MIIMVVRKTKKNPNPFVFEFYLLEWQTSPSAPVIQISTISNNRLDEIDNEEEVEDNQKEMQSLL